MKGESEMEKNGKRKLSDLIISYGGMIIVALGIGLMFLISYEFKSTSLTDYANLIGVGIAILFMVLTFTSYYQTVNSKDGKPRESGEERE